MSDVMRYSKLAVAFVARALVTVALVTLALATLALVAHAAGARADFPRPKVVAPASINLSPGGVPVPDRAPEESAHPSAVPLWPNGAPGSEARRNEPEQISWRQEQDIVFPVVFNVHNPSITPFLPAKDKATGCAVIIAPGGGHMQHTIDREGYDLAKYLAGRGIAAFVLKYRLARDQANLSTGAAQPYTIEGQGASDASRAIRLVRARAGNWNVKPDRIGILGFSAGGELAILAALRHDAGKPGAADPVERVSSRPDFFAPIYPGGLGSNDLERRDGEIAKDRTPPAFLACTVDDRMPVALATFWTALNNAGVNAELHIYNSGGHGFGVRADRPNLSVSTWHARLVDWLGDRGFLKKGS
jgi:acetyl esterase/lipase